MDKWPVSPCDWEQGRSIQKSFETHITLSKIFKNYCVPKCNELLIREAEVSLWLNLGSFQKVTTAHTVMQVLLTSVSYLSRVLWPLRSGPPLPIFPLCGQKRKIGLISMTFPLRVTVLVSQTPSHRPHPHLFSSFTSSVSWKNLILCQNKTSFKFYLKEEKNTKIITYAVNVDTHRSDRIRVFYPATLHYVDGFQQ